jgi:protoporphyrinogen oxidase
MIIFIAVLVLILIIIFWQQRYEKTVIVVGGGIAGLLSAYRLSDDPKQKVIVIEKERFGGRAFQKIWHDSVIDYGAGVIRENDVNVQKLCEELDINLHPIPNDLAWYSKIKQLSEPELKDLITRITNKYEETKETSVKLTFTEFLNMYFPKEKDQMIKHLFYTDMLDAGVADTIYNYPLTDALPMKKYWPEGGPGAIPEKLLNILKSRSNVELKIATVEKFKPGDKVTVHTKNNVWQVDKLILAVTLHPLKTIIKNSELELPILDKIGSVEFVRGFSYFADKLPNMPGFIVTDQMNQRVIKINDHVLMSIYADNEYAKYWQTHADAEAVDFINQDLNLKLKAQDFTRKYWQDGIHYYKPGELDRRAFLKAAKNPWPNVKLVGEMFSIEQGWMEGAVTSTIL